MSFSYDYKSRALTQAAKNLKYFEKDSKETHMAYGVPIRGPGHLDAVRFIGCGAWFSDQLDDGALEEDEYDDLVTTLRRRAKDKWPKRFVTPEELAAFLNVELPTFGPTVLTKPIGVGFCDFIRSDMEYCWGCHMKRVQAQLAQMDTDLKEIQETFARRKKRWETINHV